MASWREELKELARGVRTRVPWKADVEGHRWTVDADGCRLEQVPWREDAEYLAACSPDRIMRLISALEEAEARCGRAIEINGAAIETNAQLLSINKQLIERQLSGLSAQDLALELMRRGSANYFNAVAVIEDLERNRRLWEAAWFGIGGSFQGMVLRDLPKNCYHGDTLWITTTDTPLPGPETSRLQSLTKLSERWEASETDCLRGGEVFDFLGRSPGPHDVVLRLWWD